MTRTYSEMAQYESFRDRFLYLKLSGGVAHETFGVERYLNQEFYRSAEWKHMRDYIIARDLGRDLGVEGHEIHSRLIVHHINPVTPDEIIHGADSVLDPDNLITTTHDTHNAIHYGDESYLDRFGVDRTPGDTNLWRPIR